MTTEEARGIEAWEDPPDRRTRYDWSSIAKQLHRRPGKWAKVFEQDRSSLVVALRQGSIKALHPDKGFVFRSSNNARDVKPRVCALHAKYLPENDKTKED